MYRLRFHLALPLFSLLITILPIVTFADTSIKGKANCPQGSSSVDPSGQKTFGMTNTAAGDIQSYVHSVESCASACFDENLDVQIVPSGVTIVVKAINECKTTPLTQPEKATPPRGCSANQTQPLITLEVPDIKHGDTTYLKQQKIGPKSRCYEAVTGVLNSLTQGGISGPSNPDAIQSNFDSLNSLSTQAPIATTGSVAGNDQLVNALTTSGINQDDAKKIAADPVSAQALINAYATGNKNTIQDTVQDAAAKAGISLNNGVYDTIASLSADKLQPAQDALTPLADTSGTIITSDTFVPPSGGTSPSGASLADGNVCGFSGIAGMMMNPETHCGSVQAPAGQSAQGPLQYQCGTWQAYTAATGHSDWSDCSNRYDAAKAVQVTNDYYQKVWQPQNEQSCAAANISLPSCAYTSHWLGVGGGPALVKALPNLDMNAPITSLCGTATLSQAACDQNPGLIYADSKNRAQPYTIGGVFQHMDSMLGVSSAAPSTYAGASSPFAAIGGGNLIIRDSYTSSPFANVSPFSVVPGLGSSQNGYASQYQQGQYGQPISAYPINNSYANSQQQQQQQSPSPTQSPQPTPTPTPSPTIAPPPAAAQIIAQPNKVARGTIVTVAWSSTGMSSTALCRIVEASSTELAYVNEGSTQVTASNIGTLTFSLSCTSASTQASIKKTASVVVQ